MAMATMMIMISIVVDDDGDDDKYIRIIIIQGCITLRKHLLNENLLIINSFDA